MSSKKGKQRVVQHRANGHEVKKSRKAGHAQMFGQLQHEEDHKRRLASLQVNDDSFDHLFIGRSRNSGF